MAISLFYRSSSFSWFFLSQVVVPKGTEGVDANFDCELAHEAKEAGTASETESQPERRVLKVLVNCNTGEQVNS